MNVIVLDELTTIGNASGVKIEPRKPIIGGNCPSLAPTMSAKCSRSLLRTLCGGRIVNRMRYMKLYFSATSLRKRKKYGKILGIKMCKLKIKGKFY
jgi:hypothetical protein